MPPFELGKDVHANVAALLKALGSVTRPLSYRDLAALLNQRDNARPAEDRRELPPRQRNVATIQRWLEGIEPDLLSLRIMADLAGVPFEAFALGTGRAPRPGAHGTPAPRPTAERRPKKQA